MGTSVSDADELPQRARYCRCTTNITFQTACHGNTRTTHVKLFANVVTLKNMEKFYHRSDGNTLEITIGKI